MIGDKIGLYRKRKGITQEALAVQLDVSRQTITKWESSLVIPTLDYIIKMADIFGVTIDNLVRENDCLKQSIMQIKTDLDWIDFMLKAKKETYAKKQGKVASSRPNSHDYQYREDDYLYIDTFLGSEYFGGEECVYKNDVPIYVMNYYGRVIDEAFNGEFLKESLMLVDHESLFRGPSLHINGEYAYHCSYDGDVNMFNGKEEIYYNNTKVYECTFHGGLVK